MPQFKVKVIYAPAPFQYEVEVEADNETKAACAAYGQMETLSEGTRYWGDDGKFSSEIDQLTACCEECDVELPTAEMQDGFCAACAQRIDAEEKGQASRDA